MKSKLFLLTCLASALCAGQRAGVEVQVGPDDGYAYDGYYTDWYGPGWYYGIYFYAPGDYYAWRGGNHGWPYHHGGYWRGGGGHGGWRGGGHGGGHGGHR